ncbi:hypothetical protein LCGC14_0534860 [marine sediment metagenome]|uniref:Zinc-ribbon domain-containing protein n=1 Tax=marine sediment metagenome TaxID=412755 RepID=A0A0F9RUP5_9ZZZZ
MSKICHECGQELEQNDGFCTRCGTKQEEPEKPKKKKRGWNLLKKKEEKIIPSRMVEGNEMEDFKLYPRTPQKREPDRQELIVDALIRVEQKIDGLLSNQKWLLMNLENFVQGFKQQPEKEAQENNK